jgi:hypothetical protein
MSSKRLLALAGALAGAGALAYAALTRAGTAPVDAIPADSFLVATVDVAGIRASPLGAPLFEKDLAWGNLADLSHACGFDPTTRLKELDFAVPEEGDTGDFGLAFSAEVSRDELIRCAESVAGQRGESRSAATIGHFRLMDDEKGHALAVRETGNPILVGKRTWVGAMIDAADGRTPSLRANREHMALRESLASHGRPLLLITALLPSALRDRLKREMDGELGEPSRATDDPSAPNARMRGVLGVTAVGLAVRLTGDGALEARVEARCETDGACAEVRGFVLSMRLRWSQDLALRVVGLGPAIDALDAVATDASLTITTRTRAEDLAAALERFHKLRGRSAKDRPPSPSRPPPTADEIVRPRSPRTGEPSGDAGAAGTPP